MRNCPGLDFGLRLLLAGIVLSCPTVLLAQLAPVELRLHIEQGATLKPLQRTAVQVRAYALDPDNAGRLVRVLVRDPEFEVVGEDEPILSKPFRFQGQDGEEFYRSQNNRLEDILRGATGEIFSRDAALFTAPSQPGRYRLRVRVAGLQAEEVIQVAGSPQQPAEVEKHSFLPGRPLSQPYRRIAEYYAPKIAQATWFDPKADYLARFDFDGDWRGENNWESAPWGSSQAYVYYAAMETETHWFLVYMLFHPRDYSDKCIAGSCHENDSEGLILTILKDGTPWGRLQVMETLAHNNVYSYSNESNIGRGVHGLDGPIAVEGERPVVFVESGGHGVYGAADRRSLYDSVSDRFTLGTGVTYQYRGRAERPSHPNQRDVGYDLLPALEELWLLAHTGGSRAGDAFGDYFRYQPKGGRPPARFRRLAGAFRGRTRGSNKAKPFWSWHDRRTVNQEVLAPGQWGLDPAYAVSRHLELPRPFSLTYLFNPFLRLPTIPAAARPNRPVWGRPADDRAADPVLPAAHGEIVLKRKRGFDEAARRGEITLKLEVDDELLIWVRHDRMSYRVISGKPPEDQGSDMTQPLASQPVNNLQVKRRKGRGRVTLVERPSEQNHYTAAILVSDPRAGSGSYRIRLRWQNR